VANPQEQRRGWGTTNNRAASMIKGTHGWSLPAAVTDEASEESHRMWPTPNSSPATASQTVEATQRLRASRDRKQGILIEAVVDRMLPTPTARDWKGARKPETEIMTQESREEREQLASRQDSSLSKGHTQSELGGVADGIPTRLDGHLGFEREPNIPRVATGIPDRVNRLKALGNSIVPQIVYNIGLAILEEEKRTNVTK
jgi:hypothetical protein